MLQDAFSGTVNVGGSNATDFGRVWNADRGVVNFGSASGVRELSESTFDTTSTTDIQNGITALFTADLSAKSGTNVNVTADSTLRIDEMAMFNANADLSFPGDLLP